MFSNVKPRWSVIKGDRLANKLVGDRQRPVFIFSPRAYNWQWSTVQRLHWHDPVFRKVILECNREIQGRLGWSLDELLGRDSKTINSNFSDEHFEPTLTAVQIAQVEVWRRRGVEAGAVAGYCVGESAAAYAAGALSAEEAMRVACTTSQMLKEAGAPSGGMIVAQVGSEEATRLRAAMQQAVHIIVESAPRSTIFGGSEEAVAELVSLLAGRGVEYQRLPTSFVSHVPLLDSGKAHFLSRLTGLAGRSPAIPVYSATSGGLLRDARFDAQHWHGVIARPALVGDVTRCMLQDGYDRFLSISLGPGVIFPIREIASTLGKEVIVSSSLNWLAEHEAPSRRQHTTPMAVIRSALKRALRPTRRSGW